MTKITIRYQGTNEFISLVSEGHAGSARYGEDLVCAGVSAVILGGINALEEDHYEIKADEAKGRIELSNLGKMGSHDTIVIETIVSQLKAIARDNPKFVTISVVDR